MAGEIGICGCPGRTGGGGIIRFDRVTFGYPGNPVFADMTYDFPESGCLWLAGSSGCGKTTLLRLISGLEKPQSGHITGVGRVAMVFQEDRLLPWRSVWDNILIATEHPDPERVEKILGQLGIAEAAGSFPNACSGGMRRRAAIARAMAAEADVLLLDEPFTGLDPERKSDTAALLRELYRDRLILLVTHDPGEAEAMGADKILNLTIKNPT